MIIVTDATDRIKIYTVSSGPGGVSRREYVAAIKKRDFAIANELKTQISPEDLRELEEIIEVYRHAEHLRLQATALNLPATLRVAIDYARDFGNEAEVKLLTQVVEDARRELSRLDVQDRHAQQNAAHTANGADHANFTGVATQADGAGSA